MDVDAIRSLREPVLFPASFFLPVLRSEKEGFLRLAEDFL